MGCSVTTVTEARSEKLRTFFAKLLCTAAKLDEPRIEEAFRTVRREPFAGPGPWWMSRGAHPYVQTPDDDPAFLYQDLLIALDRERGINIGMPGAHVTWLASCRGEKRPHRAATQDNFRIKISAAISSAIARTKRRSVAK